MSSEDKSDNPNILTREDQLRLREHFEGDAYGALLVDPSHWRSLAQRLWRSGILLAAARQRASMDPSSGRIGVVDEWWTVDLEIHLMAAMMFGYALEVMAKGIVIKQRRLDPKAVTEMPPDLANHDIDNLLRLTGIKLTSEEREIIPFLGDCAVWMGRYPVPRRKPKPERGLITRSRMLEGYALPGSHFAELERIMGELYRKLCDIWNAA